MRREGEHGKLAHALQREGERKRDRGRSSLERGERAGDEGEEPPEGAERDEAVEVPRGVVRERAALPFELVRPGASFGAPVFVRLCRHDCQLWAVH